MIKSESIVKLSDALCKAQKKFKTAVKKCENPYFKSKYADYSEVLNCVKTALNEEGISIIQPIKEDTLETILVHQSGEYIGSTTKIYNVSNKPQDYGSAITYARRYALSSLLAIDSDDDDDGNRANNNTELNEKLIKIKRYISQLLTNKEFETDKDLEKYLGVSLTDISINNLPIVESKLKAHIERKRK